MRTSVTGPDGLTTSWEHDDVLGRLTRETRPVGHTDYAYLECSVCFPQHAAYFARALDSTGAQQYSFFDALGRAVGSESPLAGGARSREEVRYEATGRVDQHTQPYVARDPVFWIDEGYDLIGRLVSENAPIDEQNPSGAVTLYEYRGPEVWVTDPKSHRTKYVHLDGAEYRQATGLGSVDTTSKAYTYGTVAGIIATIGLARLGLPSEAGAVRGGAAPVRLGQAGEASVRAAYDVGPKATRVINGRTRIFDGLTVDAVSEVKNVKKLPFTQQLRDTLTYA